MTIKYVKFRLKNESELALLNRESSTYYISCMDYIRGSRLYGAFGNALILRSGLADEIYSGKKTAREIAISVEESTKFEKLFKNFFLNKKLIISFSDALICPKDMNHTQQGEAIPPLLTLNKCRMGNVVKNGIVQHIQDVSRILLEKQIKENPLMKNSRLLCKKCGSPMKKFSSLLYYSQPEKKLLTDLSTKISAKVGIARHPILKSVKKEESDTESETKGQMYTMEYIDRGQFFEFYSTYDSEFVSSQDIINFIEESYIGAKRNAGFGKVKIEKIQEYSEEKLTNNLYKRYNIWCNQDNNESDGIYDTYIPFYLQSDYIPSSDEEFEEIKLKENWKIYQLSAKTTRIGLFIAKDGTEPTQYKTYGWRRGSCFYLKTQSRLEKDDCRELIKSRTRRIGDLTHRGFGEIRILPEFFFINYN
jgi:CRISPR/Cas system CSM-associated protein Csm4 (group 5 of RAMP superfamily)